MRLLLVPVLLLALAPAALAQAAAMPAERKDVKVQERHAELVRQAQAGAEVMFLGDSITEGWRYGGASVWKKDFAPLGAANFGISSDRTQNVLWRIQHGELNAALPPKVVVLLIGVNNITSDPPSHVSAGVAAILREIAERAPKARVLLLGIFPFREKADDPMRQKVRDANALLAKLSDGKRVHFLDFGDRFLEKDGSISSRIMRDYLHPGARGYEIWADAIREPLRKLLQAP